MNTLGTYMYLTILIELICTIVYTQTHLHNDVSNGLVLITTITTILVLLIQWKFNHIIHIKPFTWEKQDKITKYYFDFDQNIYKEQE